MVDFEHNDHADMTRDLQLRLWFSRRVRERRAVTSFSYLKMIHSIYLSAKFFETLESNRHPIGTTSNITVRVEGTDSHIS